MLAFDIDAKNIASTAVKVAPIDGSSPCPDEETLIQSAPTGYEYRFEDIEAAINIGFDRLY